MQRQRHATVFAVLVAVAVTRVQHVFDLLAIEGDETEPVSDELVSEHRRVGFDFYEIDGYSGDFCEDGTPEGVGECKIYVAEGEINAVCGGL